MSLGTFQGILVAVNVASAAFNIWAAADSFTKFSDALNRGHFISAAAHLLFSAANLGFALYDMWNALIIASGIPPGGGGAAAAVVGGGSMTGGAVAKLALQELLRQEWGLITTRVAPALAGTALGLLSMASQFTDPSWDGGSGIPNEGNWTWQEPQQNPSPVDNLLPNYGEFSNKTFGRFDALGKSAWLQSGVKGPAKNFFSKMLGQLSEHAKEAIKHVEGHAAAIMRMYRLHEGAVTINFPFGPCDDCIGGVPELLDDGQKLWVNSPHGLGYFTNKGWFPQ